MLKKREVLDHHGPDGWRNDALREETDTYKLKFKSSVLFFFFERRKTLIMPYIV